MGGGGGIGDYIKGLLGSLGGGAAQAATPPADGAGAAPATMGGFAMPEMPKPGLLDSPALQGALATYLGAISAPRRTGLGGAIGQGGLAGLQAYSQARQSQYQPYLIGAQLAEKQANIEKEHAQAGHFAAQTKQLEGELQGNKQFSATLYQFAQNAKTPEEAQLWTGLAAGVASSPKGVNVAEIMKDPYTALKDMQETKRAQFETEHVMPAQVAHEEAATAHEKGETGLIPARQAEIEAQTRTAGVTQAKDAQEMEKNLAAEYDQLHPGYMGGKAFDTEARDRERIAYVRQGMIRAGFGPSGQTGTPPGGGTASNQIQAKAQASGLTRAPDGSWVNPNGVPHGVQVFRNGQWVDQ